MQNQMNKRSTAFPVLYIVAAAIMIIFGIVANHYVGAATMEQYGESVPAGGFIWFLYSVAILVPSVFLSQHKNLKWCVLFMLIGVVVSFIWGHNIISFVLDKELGHSDEGELGEILQDLLPHYQDEVREDRTIGGVVLLLSNILLILTFIPSIVLSAAILWANDKKVFTALTSDDVRHDQKTVLCIGIMKGED
ncbi:hypothetical protein [Ruminococcus sp.]|uniref:hypothetical protein n=1 Tax=Ruminococcus sp. TaxID=41978 RepID=UPI003FEF9518